MKTTATFFPCPGGVCLNLVELFSRVALSLSSLGMTAAISPHSMTVAPPKWLAVVQG
tara:strand:- start:968 stop:1138 length:171 start_codon:yes stop_codon:yes gene_type:complete